MESGTSSVLWIGVVVVGTVVLQGFLFGVYLWWKARRTFSPLLAQLTAKERHRIATEVQTRMARLRERQIRTQKTPRTPEEKQKPEARKGVTFVAS
jgi:uncharacterized iron-regulated membrane protein